MSSLAARTTLMVGCAGCREGATYFPSCPDTLPPRSLFSRIHPKGWHVIGLFVRLVAVSLQLCQRKNLEALEPLFLAPALLSTPLAKTPARTRLSDGIFCSLGFA